MTMTEKYPFNVINMIFGEDTISSCADIKDKADEIDKLLKIYLRSISAKRQRVFLLYAQNYLSYEEIAKQEHITTDYVDEIIARTLRFLRHPDQSKRLAKYLKYTKRDYL
jgi:predicted DNA-binding protein YlxM (UPF0122 family)